LWLLLLNDRRRRCHLSHGLSRCDHRPLERQRSYWRRPCVFGTRRVVPPPQRLTPEAARSQKRRAAFRPPLLACSCFQVRHCVSMLVPGGTNKGNARFRGYACQTASATVQVALSTLMIRSTSRLSARAARASIRALSFVSSALISFRGFYFRICPNVGSGPVGGREHPRFSAPPSRPGWSWPVRPKGRGRCPRPSFRWRCRRFHS
jgi:hypothetical protein